MRLLHLLFCIIICTHHRWVKAMLVSFIEKKQLLTIILSILAWMLPHLVCWLTLFILTGHMMLVAMDIMLAVNYDFFSYHNVCIYKLGWCSVNTISRVLNHIHVSLERADHQHSTKVCGVCITTLRVELWVKICNTCDILCECYHILVHISL